MDRSLLLFAKVPRPGAVKTRLTPVLSPSEAARLYTAFLRDTVRKVRQLDADVRLYLAPPLPDDELEGVPSDVSIYDQRGDSLGPRMKYAFQETLDEGFEQVLLMGSDHPTLPLSFVRQGFRALRQDRAVCIGPTDDGGFYLIGMSAFYPQFFEEMSYSHSRVLSDTLARADRTDARITVLPRWYDVDTPQDLGRMCRELTEKGDAPNTRRLVDHLGLETLV